MSVQVLVSDGMKDERLKVFCFVFFDILVFVARESENRSKIIMNL